MLSLTSLITAAVEFVQSLLFNCVLLSKKQKQLSDWILLLWFSFFALHLCLLFNLEGLGYECGFNTLSAFNAAFKKHTGKTPSEYRKKYLETEPQ